MDNSSVAPRLLPFHILEEITNGFSKERRLGAGSYGIVYKGVYEGGETIAVKVLPYIPGLDDELFEKEYLNLATLHHKHIVRLVGYSHETHRECLPYKGKMVFAEMTKRALCFEYMPNGSLDKCLSGMMQAWPSPFLLGDESGGHDWPTCYAIIKGVCEGIQYLHQELDCPMYHLDLKPGNVLLDENMAPKIADFGLSRFYGDEKTEITKSSFGTPGYLPPEYIDSGIVSDKFDIFSLGVVIIKIMMGRKGYFRSAEMSPEKFIELVHANWKDRLQTTPYYELYSEQAKGCIELALACVNVDRHKRPSIGVIIKELNQTETMIKLLDESSSNTQGNELEMLNLTATGKKGDKIVAVDVASTLKATTINVGEAESYDNVAVEKLLLDGAVITYMPCIQIVIVTVGTRGEVQPFIAIGKRLQDYGHRVRLAAQAKYKEFVLTAGLEFFPLGGDPEILTGYVMKNRGFPDPGPSKPIERREMKHSMFSLLPACMDPDPDTGIPYKVDAIIANPLAHGITHVAEALKVPIHIFYTTLWTSPSKFAHPLSRVNQSAGYRLQQIFSPINWLVRNDMVNEFRRKKLRLAPVKYLTGAHGSGSDTPRSYIWSPHLIPKSEDWDRKTDVVGFCFLDLASNYTPSESLVKWLEAGDKPIYVGFGSLTIQDPAEMTATIIQALEITGERGIINKGLASLQTMVARRDFLYVLDDCPHDWLFLQCKAVVHHGGAGTTAAGLKAECPTTIVHFFDDQQLWGDLVHARGLGPPPIPVDQFNLQKLVDGIKFMLEPEVKEKAVELAKDMKSEDGVSGAVSAFLKHLPRAMSTDLDGGYLQ